MRRLALCALVLVVALAAVPLAVGGTATATERQASLEQGILREVNRVRIGRGLRQLTLSRGLQAAALFQSRSLLAHGVFDHSTAAGGSFADRLRRFYPAVESQGWYVGENLLWASPTLNPAGAVRMWLDSPAHRKILLDPVWREFGIGALATPSATGVFASAGGTIIVVTIDFGARTVPQPTTW